MNEQKNVLEKAALIDASELEKAANIALDYAKQLGADQSEARLSNQLGQSVSVRKQSLESVEIHNDRSLSVNVYASHCSGSASTADLSEKGIRSTVEAAMSIAKQTEADDCFGLADKELLAEAGTDSSVLDQMHDWNISLNEMIELGQSCEQAGFDLSSDISNSEGAEVNSFSGVSAYANSHGFMVNGMGSSHSLSCSFIAEKEGAMERDYWYHSDSNPSKLESASSIGETAAERTLKRLGGKQVPTCEVPVIFDATIAGSVFSHFFGAIKGGALYKKSTFLLDHLDKQVFPEWLSLTERPHLKGRYRSALYDVEGVATPSENKIVDQGTLRSYILSSFTARKLGMKTTANAGGVRNVAVSSTAESQSQMISNMGTGLLVTELIGSGINMVTGDYSRGASGFWVENGVIQYPVNEVTIAGNLKDMFMDIVAIGSDVDTRGNVHTGSLMLEKITVAGA